MTNFERIKAMSVEEMASAILNLVYDEEICTNWPECTETIGDDERMPVEACISCVQMWLESEESE